MSPVLGSLFSATLLLAAVNRLSEGMVSATAAAAEFNAALNEEYHLHRCGAVQAAAANLAAGALVLKRMFPDMDADWSMIADHMSSDLTAQAEDGDQDEGCRTELNLHRQSPGATPEDFPNHIYRLPWPITED